MEKAANTFLFCADEENGDLFILHRGFPACLIQVVQTTPATFRVVDLYDEISETDLLSHPFLNKAKAFYKEKIKSIEGGN